MKIEDIYLTEAPLPSDWDEDIYNERIPFKTRVEYAKERAEKLGTGSARIAFEIPYQGRSTVLKIAKNRKGMAQNKAEAQLLDDWYIKNIGNVIPVIDYDERNANPTWIHTERALKITQGQLERAFGGASMYAITSYLNVHSQGKSAAIRVDLPESVLENENFQMLQDLVLNFDLPPHDFGRAANWGMYRGTPVIVDIGFTKDTMKLYM